MTRRVYVSGPMATKTFTVATGSAIPIGVFVETASTVALAATDAVDVTVFPATAVATRSFGIAYAADFTGKYASATGTGIGTATTQNSVAAGEKVTVILRGSGGVVEAFAGAAGILPGQELTIADGGSITSTAVGRDPGQILGHAITYAESASDKILMILDG